MLGPLVHDLLGRSAQRRPEALLLVDGADRTSYGQIDERANRAASVLVEQGIRRGDRVALIADNSRAYVEAYYGILRSGGVVVSMSPASDANSLRAMLRDCGARGLVCGQRQARTVAALLDADGLEFILGPAEPSAVADARRHRCRLLDAEAAIASGEPKPPAVQVTADHRAAIVYTSGSTRRPRGVVLRHSNIVANTGSIVEYLKLTAGDRIFIVLPFHYVYGKSLLNTHVAAGGSAVIENQFLYPQQALDRLEREEATGFAGVPSTFAILLNKSNLAERRLPSLRYVTQAGGAMAPELTRRLLAALPGKSVFVMYGATEASARLSYLDPAELPRKIGSIGRAIPGVELRVLRDDGSEADVHEVGEIVARGPNIMEGYWNDPEETVAVLDALGYHTGDLGRRDDEGYLYVVGRKREMIKSGAHRISPKEIEETLAEHEAVDEAGVVGVPDVILGEAIVAFVTLRPGATEGAPAALAEWCRRNLPTHKIPGRVLVLDEFPRNASGKIDKLALGAAAAAAAPAPPEAGGHSGRGRTRRL